jgi:catecholate siderophore receptor
LGAASLAAGAVQAQQAERQDGAQPDASTDVVEVVGQRPEQGLGTRYTAPLLETPQTITSFRDHGSAEPADDARGAVDAAGHHVHGGEGGGGYGDGVNLCGHTASSDISTDGAQRAVHRTDPSTSSSSVRSGANLHGRGLGRRSINLVTKRPTACRHGTRVRGRRFLRSLHVGPEARVGEDANVRVNVMAHRNDVPGRDVERYERWGVAPSLELGGEVTRVTLSYFHQEDDNVPQYGVPYALGPYNDGPLRGVPTSAYYGYSNVDAQEIGVDAFTTVVDHEFGSGFSLRNLTRWQQVDQFTFADQPQGAWCVETGVNPWTGAACAAPGTFVPNRSGTVRDTANEILVNQTDFTLELATGRVQHTLVTGFSFSGETYHRDNGNGLRNPLGLTPNPVLPPMRSRAPITFIWDP